MKSNSSLRSEAAFTLTELCVVLGCVAVLALLVLPALAGSKGNSQVFQCMENIRRLTLAWRMYAEDNSDLMVYSSDDGNGNAYSTVPSGGINHRNDLYAWTWSKIDFNGANGFNWDTNADITLRPLWQYVKDTTVYKCPADKSTVTVSGAVPNTPYKNGDIAPRIRSYSMNYYLGGLGGNGSLSPAHFPIYFKLTDLNNWKSPGPNQTFVFIDERSDCINWGNFETDMTGYPVGTTKAAPAQYQWSEDMPASYHNYAGCLSFADGHAEIHRWNDSVVLQPLVPDGPLAWPSGQQAPIFPDPFGQDVPYMQNASARPH